MSIGHVRPRFQTLAPGLIDLHIERLQAAVDAPGSNCVMRTLENHIDITFDQSIRHRWSPCLQMELTQSADDTTIHGHIGPHPNTWTLFMFINTPLLLIATFGGMFWLIQRSLNGYAWAFWIVLGGIVGLIFMYILSQIGKHCARKQTSFLIDFLESALQLDSTTTAADAPSQGSCQ